MKRAEVIQVLTRYAQALDLGGYSMGKVDQQSWGGAAHTLGCTKEQLFEKFQEVARELGWELRRSAVLGVEHSRFICDHLAPGLFLTDKELSIGGPHLYCPNCEGE